MCVRSPLATMHIVTRCEALCIQLAEDGLIRPTAKEFPMENQSPVGKVDSNCRIKYSINQALT